MGTDSEAPGHGTTFWDPEARRREILRNIRVLEARSARGVWHLCLFLAVSLAAHGDFRLFPSLPPDVRAFLGRAPPANWVSGALVVYSFSALVLALSRLMEGTEPRDGLSHVGYLSAFYAFYHLADALPDNFWAVFVAGLTILGLAAYSIWSCTSEKLRGEWERLNAIQDRGDGVDSR